MIVSPCKDCPERFVGCHSSCERYKQYRSELDAFKAIRAADKDERAFASEIKGAVKRLRDHKRGKDRNRRRRG